MWKIAWLSLASLPLKTEILPRFVFFLSTRYSHRHGPVNRICVGVAIRLFTQAFVLRNPRKNTAYHSMTARKIFSETIFKQKTSFHVKNRVNTPLVSLILRRRFFNKKDSTAEHGCIPSIRQDDQAIKYSYACIHAIRIEKF